MGIPEVLTIIFVILKLTEHVDWSWWLVFAPMYVYIAAFIAWLMFTLFMAFLTGVLQGIQKSKMRKK